MARAKRQLRKEQRAVRRAPAKGRRQAKKAVRKIGNKSRPVAERVLRTVVPAARLVTKSNRKKGEQIVEKLAKQNNVTPARAAIELVKENPDLQKKIATIVKDAGAVPETDPQKLVTQGAAIKMMEAQEVAEEKGIDEDEAFEEVMEEEIEEAMSDDSDEDEFDSFDPVSAASVVSGVFEKVKGTIQKVNEKRVAKGKPKLFQSKKKAKKIQAQAKEAANTKVNDLSNVTAPSEGVEREMEKTEAGIKDIYDEVRKTEMNKFIGENFLIIILLIALLLWAGKKL